jgi:hypothetical protein
MVEVTATEKHSSLLQNWINYGRKKRFKVQVQVLFLMLLKQQMMP